MAIGTTLARSLASILAAGALASSAAASPIVVDWSPQALGGTVSNNAYMNRTGSQHFAEAVSFDTTTLVDGMDIYSGGRYGALGTLVDITIWADNGGRPGELLGRFGSSLSAIDGDGASSGNLRKHADFAGFTMAADVLYWVGMAGQTAELAQAALRAAEGGDGRMAQFTGMGGFLGDSKAGDMAFRLYGNAMGRAAMPEPGSLALFGLAGAAFLMVSRRSRAR